MPLAGQSSLTTIVAAQSATNVAYTPVALYSFVFTDGTTLYVSTKRLTYGGNAYLPLVTSTPPAIKAGMSDSGIDIIPTVSVTLADADLSLWTTYESPKGFKGAKLTVTFVFWDAVGNTFSSDSRVAFVGKCDSPSTITDESITVQATNILQLARTMLPGAQVSRFCLHTFPAGGSTANQTAALNDPSSPFHTCGYSPDVGGVGNSGFTDCDYSSTACKARGMYDKDGSNRVTRRFSGIEYTPPQTWSGKSYTQGQTLRGYNVADANLYQQFYPLIYGPGKVNPVPLAVLGSANYTAILAAVCFGQLHDNGSTGWTGDQNAPTSGIGRVIVDGVEVPFYANSPDKNNFYWTWSSLGTREGAFTNDPPFTDASGNPQDDPGGSIARIHIKVYPEIFQGGGSPTIEVICSGQHIQTYNSDGSANGSPVVTANPVWHAVDLLQRGPFAATDLNLATAYIAASKCDAAISQKSMTGTDRTWARFRSSLVIRQRASLQEIMRSFRNSSKLMLVPGLDGKLEFHLEATLAESQGAPIAGSNYNTAVSSANPDGSPASGYVAYSFSEADILQDNGKLALTINQQPSAQTPNELSASINNEEQQYAADGLTINDSDDIGRMGQEIQGSASAIGIPNFDQARRILEWMYGRNYRGNPRGDSSGSWLFQFTTNFRALHLRPGHLCLFSNTKRGVSSQLVRIVWLEWAGDCETCQITARWEDEDRHLDSYGQNPVPLLQGQRQDANQSPPFPWNPNYATPAANDPLIPPTRTNFGIQQLYETAADGTSIAKVQITGKTPANKIVSGRAAPYAPTAVAATGGACVAGTYFVALAATDSAGNLGPLSMVSSATVADGGLVNIPNIVWPTGTAGYVAYGGTNPLSLTKQVSGSGTPGSVSITGPFNVSDEGPPDAQFDHLRVRIKRIVHGGVIGIGTGAITSSTITLTGQSMAVNQFANCYLSIVAKNDITQQVPLANFKVSSNTADTFTVTTDPTALGVQQFDTLVIRAAANIASANTIGDANFVNWQYPTGMTADAENGHLARIIEGKGAGQTARIAGNTGTTLTIEGTWAVTPDSTSLFIVEEDTWLVDTPLSSIANSDPEKLTIANLNVDNYKNQMLLVQVYSENADETRASVEQLSPYREIYILGQAGLIASAALGISADVLQSALDALS